MSQLGMGSTVYGSRLHARNPVVCNVWKASKLSVSQYMLEGVYYAGTLSLSHEGCFLELEGKEAHTTIAVFLSTQAAWWQHAVPSWEHCRFSVYSIKCTCFLLCFVRIGFTCFNVIGCSSVVLFGC